MDGEAGLPEEPLLQEWSGQRRLYRTTPMSWPNTESMWAMGGVTLVLLTCLTMLSDLPLRRALRRQILRDLWRASGAVTALAATVGLAVPPDRGRDSLYASLILAVMVVSRALGGILLALYRQRLRLAYRAYEFWGPRRDRSLAFFMAPLYAGFVLDLLVLLPVAIAGTALRGALL